MCYSKYLTHLVHRHIEQFSDFFRSGFSAVLMQKLRVCFFYFVYSLYHMNRNTNCSCLVCNGTSDSLSDPPCSISRELKALCVVELIYSFNKTEIALLDKIKELHTSAHISLSDTNNKTQVSLSKTLLSNRIIISNFYGKLNFFLSSKKWNSANFFKINLNRIVHCSIVIYGNGFCGIGLLREIYFKGDTVQSFCRKVINNIDICRINHIIEFFKFIYIQVELNNKIIYFLSCQMSGCLTFFYYLFEGILLFFLSRRKCLLLFWLFFFFHRLFSSSMYFV